MKSKILSVLQIALNILLIPMYFINFFHYAGVIPAMNEETGEFFTAKVEDYSGPWADLKSLDAEWLMYLSFILIAVSVIFSAVGIVKNDNGTVKGISRGAFVCSVLVFVLAFFISSTVTCTY